MNKIILRGLGIILNVILTILSYLIPKDKRLILLGSYEFAGNTRTFYLYLQYQQNYFKAYWITHRKDICKLLQDKRLPVLYIYTPKAFWYILRANFLILTHGALDTSYFYFLFGRFNMIQTWHGIPLKDISFNPRKSVPLSLRIIDYLFRFNNKSYKLILATSEETQKIFKAVFNNPNVKIIGYPRNDVFYNHELLFEDYKEKLKLDRFKKVILYCPTFRDATLQNNDALLPFSKSFLNILNEYLSNKDYILLIKKHPYDKSLNVENFANIIDISDMIIDVQDLLLYTDILITDYSSIMFDFVLLNRPIIFYPYDIQSYTARCRSLYYDYFEELPGPFAIDEKELLTLLKNIDIIFKDNYYQYKYKAFKDKFHYYQDGNSCKRLLDILISLINK
ncbi:MAG: CDP-glycerol glycerophosphotransferase family protein [Candidatus Nitrosocaldus sp.]